MDKRSPGEQPHEDPEIRAEYDFSKGVRGKYHKEYLEGHSVIIHKTDGTVTERQVKREQISEMLGIEDNSDEL
jgi:hypothetical protein